MRIYKKKTEVEFHDVIQQQQQKTGKNLNASPTLVNNNAIALTPFVSIAIVSECYECFTASKVKVHLK